MNNRKKSRKPFIIFILFVFVFVLLIYFLVKPSRLNMAIDQVQICSNLNEVKEVFDRNKYELIEKNESGKTIVSPEFVTAIKEKLSSLNLGKKDIEYCLSWLPSSDIHINVIVIPDLSRRIIDTFNNPKQIASDLKVLESLWSCFAKKVMYKEKSKDKFLIDVTDIEQAKGQFSTIADLLVYDLSRNLKPTNRQYFSDDLNNQFVKNIKNLYKLASDKPLGADYLFYFQKYLSSRLKKSTIFDRYVNKIVIITDGYLEAENRTADTKLTEELYGSLINGNTKEVITNLGLNIPKVEIDLSNTEILICEVNERKGSKEGDYIILKAYWEDWLTRMNVNKFSFIRHEQAFINTKEQIEAFINQ